MSKFYRSIYHNLCRMIAVLTGALMAVSASMAPVFAYDTPTSYTHTGISGEDRNTFYIDASDDGSGNWQVAYCFNYTIGFSGSPLYGKVDGTVDNLEHYATSSALSGDELRTAIMKAVYNGYPKNAGLDKNDTNSVWAASGLDAYADKYFRWATQCAVWHFTDNVTMDSMKGAYGIRTIYTNYNLAYSTYLSCYHVIQNYYSSGATLPSYYQNIIDKYEAAKALKDSFEAAYTMLIDTSNLTDYPSGYTLSLYVHDSSTSVQNLLSTGVSSAFSASTTVSVTVEKTWRYPAGTTLPTTADFLNYIHLYKQHILYSGGSGEPLDEKTEVSVSNENISITDDGSGVYTVTFSNLPKEETTTVNGTEGIYYILYSIEEDAIPGYYSYGVSETSTNNFEITNSTSVSVTGTKIWDDQNDQHGYRPSAEEFASWLELQILGGMTVEASPVITTGGDGTWTITYSDLPQYAENGTLLEYQIDEVIPGHGTSSAHYDLKIITDETTGVQTITNTEVVNIPVKKEWAAGASGDEAVVVLRRGGIDTETTLTLNQANDWSGVFTNLPVYDENGNPYVYTVAERTSSYRFTIQQQSDGSWVITNYPIAQTTTKTIVPDTSAY
jgi:TQXA domain-containing protein